MAHTKVYGFCDAKCKVEVSPKTDVDKKLNKSGDTMTGTLYVNNAILIVKRTSVESNNSATSNTEIGRLQFRSNTNETANVISVCGPANNSTFLRATRKVGESNVDADICAVIGVNGDRYGTAPTPSNPTDSSSKIATTQWVNDINNDLMHKSRAETIPGQKTFTSQVNILYKTATLGLKTSNFAYTERLSEATNVCSLANNDKNNTYIGGMIHRWYTDGKHRVNLECRGEDGYIAQLNLWANPDGTRYAEAPKTPDNATGNEVAVASWVNNKLAQKNKMTEFSSWAELEALIKAGKRGDSFNVTMDFSASIMGDIKEDNSEAVDTHAFGHFFIDEITVEGGTITKSETFGAGEVSGKFTGTGTTAQRYGVTGLGNLAINSTTMWAFRAPHNGDLNYVMFAPSTTAPTSCTGYYISL